ncbi:cyclophilin-like fold protein [Pseudomonas graminis]|jgi:hypothetical protein|uniref:cyclophilin-like fold protein n=1 Tax=Pseudomonas graminis TaxID=158627 RepID=UPI000A7A260B|nr:cyclophilin-like fold protein [Pseudomonas graminis]
MRDHRFGPFTHAHAGATRGLTRAFGLLFGLAAFSESNASPLSSARPAPEAMSATAQQTESRIWMTVRDTRFEITLANTQAARDFVALLPLSLDMPDLNHNEKHAELPKALTTNAIRPGTIHSGDLMLYGSQTLVAFYVTFPSSYSYTRLGRVSDPAALARLVGSDAVRISFSKQ